MILRIAKQIERHARIHHRRVDGSESVGITGPLHHPLLSRANGLLPDTAASEAFPELKAAIQPQKDVTPCKPGTVATERNPTGGEKQFAKVEPFRDGTAWVQSMHDGERNHNR